MESHERYKTGINGFSRFEYRFTIDEREAFEIALKKYDPKKVKEFINHLEFYFHSVKGILQQMPTRAEVKRERESAINSLEKALKTLDKIRLGKAPYTIRINRSLMKIREERQKISEGVEIEKSVSDAFALSPKAMTALEEIIDAIKETEQWDESNGRGRPEADALGVARTIAEFLFNYLDIIPSTYRDGVFSEIVGLSLESLDLKHDDPSRVVRQAVKYFKQEMTIK